MASPIVDAPWHGVSTLGPERVLENMRSVLAFARRSPGDDATATRAEFLDVLNDVQPWKFSYQRSPAKPLVTFGDEPHFNERTLKHLMLLPELPPDWQHSAAEREEIVERLEEGRALLAEVAPSAIQTLDLLVGELVFGTAPLRSGGSIGDVIGVIWLGPKERWTAHRFAEALAHEAVHQILFLEDMTRSVFARSTDEMGEEEGLIRSALLQRRRSYDKAYHSALVSLVVIQLAEALGDRAPRFEALMAPTRVTIDEMRRKPQYLTDNGLFVLEEMDELMRSMER